MVQNHNQALPEPLVIPILASVTQTSGQFGGAQSSGHFGGGSNGTFGGGLGRTASSGALATGLKVNATATLATTLRER